MKHVLKLLMVIFLGGLGVCGCGSEPSGQVKRQMRSALHGIARRGESVASIRFGAVYGGNKMVGHTHYYGNYKCDVEFTIWNNGHAQDYVATFGWQRSDARDLHVINVREE